MLNGCQYFIVVIHTSRRVLGLNMLNGVNRIAIKNEEKWQEHKKVVVADTPPRAIWSWKSNFKLIENRLYKTLA